MPLFSIPKRPDRCDDSNILKKSKSTKKATSSVKGGGSLISKISLITNTVKERLGKYSDRYSVITDLDELHNYISACIDNGIVSIDTETEGLDTMSDKIAGLCLYTPNKKGVYVPINHISYITNDRVEPQLTESECSTELQRLVDANTFIIMFNADFDIRVCRHQLNVRLKCDWDCYLASRCLNENEPENKLKVLHNKYVLDGKGDAWTFDSLFKGIKFTLIPINTAYLYAGRDPEITYELYEFQKPFLTATEEVCINQDLVGVSNVFHNIEMRCVNVIADMEDNGILFDFNKHAELSEKYHKLLLEKEQECHRLLAEYDSMIQDYRVVGSIHLDDPVNLNSPTQVSAILYDILKVGVIDSNKPRGTGEDILQKIDLPFAKCLIEYKELSKLVSAFIDSLPEYVKSDGRIHCRLNQYGAGTGRMSCQDPNLQQIPSHNKEIRTMFRASDNYVLMSSDYSQQEPKCLAALCSLEGDSSLLNTFLSGKDLYSEIASKSFNVPYEECLEFNPDGTTNKAGKQRRTQAKSILLGILYGRGVASIAEQLNCSTEKAQSIKNSVFSAFPSIKNFEADSIEFAKSNGYVTTICGRKRRLPDIQLPEYEFSYINVDASADLLDFDDSDSNDVPYDVMYSYYIQLKNANSGGRFRIKANAEKDNIRIKDNNGFIAQAVRQCVNARIQGSSADLTKLALIDLAENEELKSLGFRLLIPVHDRLFA